MITKIEIEGFKTFRNFTMEFSPLTVIAGTNASGKSNLFDALNLLSRIAETDLRTAFSEQRGVASELFTQYEEDFYGSEMSFAVEFLLNKYVRDNWGGRGILKYTRLRYDLKIGREVNEFGLENLIVTHEQLVTLKHDEDEWVQMYIPSKNRPNWRPKVPTGRRGYPYIETDNKRAIILRQDGSGGSKKEFSISSGINQTILSSINSVDFIHAFAAKEELISWKFLQLNPQALREPTKQDIGMKDTITQSGENLAAALWRIQTVDKYALKDISRKLNNLLPSLVEVKVYNDTGNKQFIIKIRSDDGREFSSRVLSEGTLRLLALCIFQYDDQHNGLLCFEEPENGVHPARMKEIATLLSDLSVNFRDEESPLRQVIINTHSPILVSELFDLEKESLITVWLSQLVTNMVVVNDRKVKIHISKILPIDSDIKRGKGNQVELNFPEKKLALAQLRNYLEHARDVEKTIKELEVNE
jgi:predicted ATPase